MVRNGLRVVIECLSSFGHRKYLLVRGGHFFTSSTLFHLRPHRKVGLAIDAIAFDQLPLARIASLASPYVATDEQRWQRSTMQSPRLCLEKA